MRRVELVAQDVHGGHPLDVVLRAEVGGQEASELHQGVVALQRGSGREKAQAERRSTAAPPRPEARSDTAPPSQPPRASGPARRRTRRNCSPAKTVATAGTGKKTAAFFLKSQGPTGAR